MNAHRSLLMLLIVTGLFALSGASCPNWLRTAQPPALTPVLPPNPTLEQVMQVVNNNNGRIQSFMTSEATLSSPGVPSLRATVAYARPLSFRLYAKHTITGPELDLGSNPQEFWFWINRAEPKAVYFCRHDQFATSPARQMVPIQPEWLIDALGVSTFDPNLPHQPPFVRQQDGRMEVRTIKETPEGTITKCTILDPAQGWVLAQEIYNAQYQLVVRSEATGYRQDPRSLLWIPRTIKLECPAAQFSMQLDLGNVELNVPITNPQLFTRPMIQNSPPVNVGDPNFRPPGCPTAVPGT